MSEQKWFIKDEAIQKEEDDAFRHIDLAREIKAKVEEFGAPVTLGLAGPHGTGKSSVGELLRWQFKADPRYTFIRLEAWRHEGDTRRKAFLRDVIDGLLRQYEEGSEEYQKLQNLRVGLYASQATQFTVLDFTASKQAMKAVFKEANRPALKYGAVVFVVFLILALAWYFATAGVPIPVAFHSLASVLPGITAFPGLLALVTYLALLTRQMFEKILEPPKLTVTTNPPNSSERYEEIFRDALRVSEKGDGRQTAVLFVDELDRLPPDEIIEALKVIRTYRDAYPCAFVVALDEGIVTAALQQAKLPDGIVKDAEAAEEYLNKIFKARQRLPLLVVRDMREYARRLVTSQAITAGMAELPEEKLTAVLDCLIHHGVRTPRHVIRLINAFNSEIRLARIREGGASPLLSAGAITGSPEFLAVVTVLREDFPDFYAEVVANQQLVFAMDALLEGEAGNAVEARFPSYVLLCCQYFEAGTGETGEQSVTIDPGKPIPAMRSLVQYLRLTSKFRAPSLVPFIFLRQDAAGRVLGDVLTEQLVADFESYFSAGILERIKDGGDAFATAASRVAMRCLEESRGNRQENAILTICDVFSQLTASSQKEIAERTADVIFYNQQFLEAIPPAPLLSLLGYVDHQAHRDSCVASLVRQLDAGNAARSAEVLQALVAFPSLVSTEDQRQHIHAYTTALASSSPLADLRPWIRLMQERAGREAVTGGFFTSSFFEAVITATVKAEATVLPDGWGSDIGTLFSAYERQALAEWPDKYLTNASAMLAAPEWDIYDVGLAAISRNEKAISHDLAPTILAGIYGEKYEFADEEQAERLARVYAVTLALCRRTGTTAATLEQIQEAMNRHFAGAVISPVQHIRVSASECLTQLVGGLGEEYFASCFDKVIAYVPVQMPASPAHEVVSYLLKLSASIPRQKIQTLLEAVSAPLAQGLQDASSQFGAEVLQEALREDDARPPALLLAATLTPLVNASAYTPEQLTCATAVLDYAVPYMIPTQADSYANALAAYLAYTNAPQYIIFAVSHLNALATQGKIPETAKAPLAQAMVERWQYLAAGSQQEVMAQVLLVCAPRLHASLKPMYLAQQIALLQHSPIVAWSHLLNEWALMATSMHSQILAAVGGLPSLQPAFLQDIGVPERRLAPDDIASVIFDVATSISQPFRDDVVGALTRGCDEAERETIATTIYNLLAELPDPLSAPEALRLAGQIMGQFSDAALAFYTKLIRGDRQQRYEAFKSLLSLPTIRLMGDDQRLALSQTLSTALAADELDLLAVNLDVAEISGSTDTPEYQRALRSTLERMRKPQNNDEKVVVKRLRSLIAKEPKRTRKS